MPARCLGLVATQGEYAEFRGLVFLVTRWQAAKRRGSRSPRPRRPRTTPAIVTEFPASVSPVTVAAMNRRTLISLLDGSGAAKKACREALRAGAGFNISEGLVPARHLAAIYRVRADITRDRGIPTIGFGEAVNRLQAAEDQALRLGGVQVDDPPYYFQLFLTADASSVLACVGVDQQHQAGRRG
jgi:hypothetical protein